MSQRSDVPRDVELLAGLPTAAISDALDRLRLPGSLHGIAPLREGQRACGTAFTVSYQPVDGTGGTVGDFLDDVSVGAVVVIDNQGRTDCTVWGGIMTRVAASRGVAATVINGVCRDVGTSTDVGYPLWSAGRFMRTGKDRVRVAAVQQPVVIDSVTISSGDIVCCDEDGVVVVPTERAAEVARIAAEIEAVESRILDAVQSGARLAEARTRFGYHALQSAPEASAQEGSASTTAAATGELIHARGHSSATLYEAARAVHARQRDDSQGGDLIAQKDIALEPSLRAAWPGARVDGPAFTVQGAGGDNLVLHHAVAAAPPGHVLVADVGGAPYGHWGEVLAVAAQARGLVGLVIDGGVRDVDEMRELGFPVFSRDNSVRGTRKLVEGRLGGEVTVAGSVVRTGDLVVGDSDGVVVIPRQQVDAVLDEADARVAKEHEIMTALRAGRTTLDLYGLA